MVNYDDVTADAGPSSGGIAIDPVRPTLQARVTALEMAFKNILKELETNGRNRDFTSNLIKELRTEVGLHTNLEAPSSPVSDIDMEQARLKPL